ncbi:MAG: hypothetical protein RR448_12500 [Niameybacter sp.]|uniref:hypothetical protein n=1 Tax=Niameybacter sp. TaxID=2033640 RepID=UPI002FC5B3F5
MSNEAVIEMKGVEVKTSSKINVKYLVHCSIGLLLMFGMGYLVPIEPITPMGMKVLGIFLGVYILTSTDTAIFLFWPILYGLFKEIGYKPGDKYATLKLFLA